MRVVVSDLLYVRMRAPDLAEAERFLVAFGMVVSVRTDGAIYMRGTDASPHILIAELGDPGIIAIGLSVSSADLEIASKLAGASGIETLSEPGGGSRVRLRDPMGYTVELVHGQELQDPIPVDPIRINDAVEKFRRIGTPRRIEKGPARVKNISHVVMTTLDVRGVGEWYANTLGLLTSDQIYREYPSNIVGAFYRLNKGDTYVDHHMLNIVKGPKVGFNHIAFEVADIDDIMKGHEHLKAGGYRHMRGPGRHFLGSQIFDYWLDPWGRMMEHLTDTDMLNCHARPGEFAAGTTDSPWGSSSSPEFRDQVSR